LLFFGARMGYAPRTMRLCTAFDDVAGLGPGPGNTHAWVNRMEGPVGAQAISIYETYRARLEAAGGGLGHLLRFHLYQRDKRVLPGRDRFDLFDRNFCPPNCCLIDRERIEPADLAFDERFSKHEDYLLLVRLAAKYACDFGGVGMAVGEYQLRSDGSNTISNAGDPAMDADWRLADAQIERAFESVVARVPITELTGQRREARAALARQQEQATADLAEQRRQADAEMAWLRGAVDDHRRIIRELRDAAAHLSATIDEIRGSTSWRATGPLRALSRLLGRSEHRPPR